MITKFKIFETYAKFDENKIKIGDILKRKTIDDKHYELSLITNPKDIQIYEFAIASLDFEFIKFQYNHLSRHDINRWYINEYTLLDENELQLLCDKIDLAEDYLIENIEKITNINLKEISLNMKSKKYNL